MVVKARPAPKGLGPAGRALWREIAAQVAADGLQLDARERRLLRDACAEADALEAVEAALDGARLMVRGSQGQDVAHPLLGEARRSRATIAQLLGRIGLEDPGVGDTGRGSRTTSTAARAAALHRHHGAGSGVGGR